MSANDVIYAPIAPGVPDDELSDLVKQIMNNPTNRKLLDSISDQIVDLFGRHGITDEQGIVDAVYKKIRVLEGNMICGIIVLHTMIVPRISRLGQT